MKEDVMFLEHFKEPENIEDIYTEDNKFEAVAFIIGFAVTMMIVIFLFMYWVW